MADPRSAQHRAPGQLIRVRRGAVGISQEDLAHEAGIEAISDGVPAEVRPVDP